MLSHKPEER